MKQANKPTKKQARAAKPAKSRGSGAPIKEHPANPFPIVAFGASAGGLEAFTSVLQQLPSDSGLSLVLVQHLDPQHSSILTELLARSTPMKVAVVTGGSRFSRIAST